MPAWRNTTQSWGLLLILLHWITAVVVFGLYALGWYMVDLSYYDGWYNSAPFWHKSVGLMLMLFVIVRIVWRFIDAQPDALASHQPWERLIAKIVHIILYLMLLVIFVSGYLIATADGSAISFFGLFDVPSLVEGVDNLEDRAGEVHAWLADSLMVLVILHALAALKHHFIDRDNTLKRMLGVS